MEREMMLQKLMELDFLAVDLGLYLNTHPTETEAINAYNQTIEAADTLRMKFEAAYGPLCSFRSYAADTENYQNNNRGNQIDNLSVPCNGDCFRVNRFFFSLSLHALIIFLHCRKIKSSEDDKEHEYNSKNCIQIKRNRPQEQTESINTAVFRKG